MLTISHHLKIRLWYLAFTWNQRWQTRLGNDKLLNAKAAFDFIQNRVPLSIINGKAKVHRSRSIVAPDIKGAVAPV